MYKSVADEHINGSAKIIVLPKKYNVCHVILHRFKHSRQEILTRRWAITLPTEFSLQRKIQFYETILSYAPIFIWVWSQLKYGTWFSNKPFKMKTFPENWNENHKARKKTLAGMLEAQRQRICVAQQALTNMTLIASSTIWPKQWTSIILRERDRRYGCSKTEQNSGSEKI
ncbi:hypothetical protein HHI36_013252 [Cryptolaemus montrouzieri]|uniref:Uncharacterized protein n=1 Tax=Cryptolaemus montrouzieri TaxID=559131 RepID=A0ABD2NGK2_9CUCU